MRRNWRISTMLRLFFILVVVLPILLICLLVLNMYKNDLLQQNTKRSLQTSEAVAYSVKQEITRMSGLFASIGVDPDVLSYASQIDRTSGVEKQIASNQLRTLIEKYIASVSGRVLSINFFYKSGGTYSYLRNMMVEDNVLRRQDWYVDTLNKPHHVQFLGLRPNMIIGNDNPYMMVSAFSPGEISTVNEIEMILFTFNSDLFDSILLSRDNAASEISIVNESGKIVATNTFLKRGSEIVAEWTKQLEQGKNGWFVDRAGAKSLVTYAKVDKTGWRIVQRIPYRELISNYSNAYAFVLLTGVLISLAFLILSFLFVNNVTRPLIDLLRQMNRFTGGDLDARVRTNGSMEMVKLGHTFNQMTDQVKLLIVEREGKERAKRKAEFEALQSQINPHFLINTLNSIKFMALISKADNIRNMTQALTRVLASSYNRGGTHSTVAEEIDRLKDYLYIMEIRFGRPFTAIWDIEPGITDRYLLKMLLQPIVENSITHGLKSVQYPGVIEITATTEGQDLTFTIADNGEGLSENALQRISGGISPNLFSGMGISNVHHRIQLHYGSRYGLHFAPNKPAGTKVVIRLPMLQDHLEEIEGQ